MVDPRRRGLSVSRSHGVSPCGSRRSPRSSCWVWTGVTVFLLMLLWHPATAVLTRQECLVVGGVIVGDIGNGATRRPGYVCASNGQPPLDVIRPAPGEPIATEGEVCCGGAGTADHENSAMGRFLFGTTRWSVAGMILVVGTVAVSIVLVGST